MLTNGTPPHLRNGSTASTRQASDPPFRHMSSGSLNIPNGLGPPNGASNGQPQIIGPAAPAQRFDGPRSPPGKQNTSHVPCKFFRQGACQAGKACPFSHDLASTNDNICKYFAKGNCKFGPKCANVHVLPNGTRVNYHKNGVMGIGPNQLNIGGRIPPDAYHGNSALTSSLYRANMVSAAPYTPQYSPFQNQDDGFPPLGHRSSMDIPTIDTTYISHSSSAYGSPRDEDSNRFGLGLSPGGPTLTALDAPLPASFDSNGVSWIARHGPVAASVPSKFGLDSPSHSLGYAKEGRTSEALKNLHSSAFGDDTRDAFNGVGASPVMSPEEYFGRRPMHSQRSVKTKIMSSSLPKPAMRSDNYWDPDDFLDQHEEILLPESISHLLTPEERVRRGSRSAEDRNGEDRFGDDRFGDDDSRAIHSGNGTPIDGPSKFGSPSNASPSSRFGSFFQRQQREEKSRASQFGHVGSPLGNTMQIGSLPNQRATSRSFSSGDAFSPPRQAAPSILSQQLSRVRLGDAAPSGISNGRGTSIPIGTTRRAEMDRQVSSSSIGTGRFTTPIDEEQPEVFSMDPEDNKDREKEKEKRNSGGWGYPVGGRSPHLNALGTSGRNGSTGNTLSRGGLSGMFAGR